MTPEGKIKMMITRVLIKHRVWYFMPVPTGLQTKTVDYLCCHKGQFIAIEAKAPGKKPTARQSFVLDSIAKAGGGTFVVSSEEDVDLLDMALENQKPHE